MCRRPSTRSSARSRSQNEGFQNLINGSRVTLEEVIRRAPANWYVEAQEALKLGLIEAVL